MLLADCASPAARPEQGPMHAPCDQGVITPCALFSLRHLRSHFRISATAVTAGKKGSLLFAGPVIGRGAWPSSTLAPGLCHGVADSCSAYARGLCSEPQSISIMRAPSDDWRRIPNGNTGTAPQSSLITLSSCDFYWLCSLSLSLFLSLSGRRMMEEGLGAA
jgi:hypothetical protein